MVRLYLFLFFLCSWNLVYAQNKIEYVNLFVGTSGDHGQLDPAATVPFGMIKLGPDTNPGNHSGYNYAASEISGFSHNRIGGVGCSGAGGNLRIFPGFGDFNIPEKGLLKESESAEPGYYSVSLANGVKAKLTATNETGFHHYFFPESDSSFIEIDIRSSFAQLIDAEYTIINQNEITVTVSAKNVCRFGRYTVYYHIWSDKELELLEDKNGKLFFKPSLTSNLSLNLKVTTSTISEEVAKEHWLKSAKETSFEKAKSKAQTAWEKTLSKIEVEGKEEYKTLFYTLLYRTMMNPVKTESFDGKYVGTDGNVYESGDFTHYGTWSMWDNFRNKFSLLAIIEPNISEDIAFSLADLYKTGKAKWSGYNEPLPTVRTEHTIITMLDLYNRGIRSFNLEKVYGTMSAEIANLASPSPDTKLEIAYDYWALSEMAKILKKPQEHSFFLNKAMEYKKTWREKFLTITDKSDIMHGDGLYEGTLWQYRWHVQFDIPGIIDMLGGKEVYNDQLEFFFDNDLYNHGNQPDLQAPFMFNHGGKPWLTQKWVNKILTKEMTQSYGTHEKWETPYVGKIYNNRPKGFIPEMDDDDGTMSAWYVLASMGMYPVLVGNAIFQLSTPIFDKVTFNLDNGKTFIIETRDFNSDSFYIQSATLNGQPFNQSFITHQQIINGGTFVIQTGIEPNYSWGN